MKGLFILVLCLFTSSFCFADDIPLRGDPPKGENPPGDRGQELLPTVDYTNGVVTIFAPYQMEDMSVTIRDSQGEILYSTIIPAINVQQSIVLSDYVDANKFSIQIAYDDIHLIGWF